MELNVTEIQPQQHQQQQLQNNQANSNDQQQQQQQQQQQTNQQNQQPPYTIPGIMHYLQYEWHRFEIERQEWEVEKAELAARIALLQGEKKSHENLKHDLVRRIKMLEYCLRMERAKYHRLKHGTDPPTIELSDDHEHDKSNNDTSNNSDPFRTSSNNMSSTATYGRELLRHYLQEIGYTDTVIDLRSDRVRSLLGIVDNNNQQASNQIQAQLNPQQQQQQQQQQQSQRHQQPSNNQSTNPQTTNNSNNNSSSSGSSSVSSSTNSKLDQKPEADSSKRTDSINFINSSNNSKIFNSTVLLNDANNKLDDSASLPEAEQSVLAKFGFLYDQAGIKDSSNSGEDEEDTIPDDVVDAADRAASTSTTEYSYFDEHTHKSTARDAKLSLKNRNLAKTKLYLASANIDGNNCVKPREDYQNENQKSKLQARNAKNWCPNPSDKSQEVVDIGELATLTTLGSEPNVSDDYRKKQWTAKFRLQSHYDCVRALCFSDSDSLLATASEDETIKLWHLSRTSSANSVGKSRQQPILPNPIEAISSLESSTLDIEPLHTYRGHKSRILSIKIFSQHIYSGGENGEIIMWKLISNPSSADQYDKFDSSLMVCKYSGHEDAVWSLEVIEPRQSDKQYTNLLCSGSADLTIKLWDITGANKEPIGVIKLDSSPTCIAKMPSYNDCVAEGDMAVSSCDGKIRLYDLTNVTTESNTQPTAIYECDGSPRINSIVIHPTLPFMASADSNHDIKFWDIRERKCKSTMVAHLDEVTSLACDPSGKYLLSASHDCSVRLWLFEEKACIQEITSHRKKFDEGIFAVAFHPRLSQFATAGADGLAKVFI